MPIYRGCAYSKDIQFKTRSDGLPVDVSTWQFEANLKDESGTIVLAMSTSESHFAVFDGTNGWLRWALTPTQSLALVAGPVSFALYRTDAVEGRKRIFRAVDQVRDQD